MWNRFLPENKEKRFYEICVKNKLVLDYDQNRTAFQVFKDIFEEREYADYFPFYKKAVVLDVGAHHGFFSLFATANLSPEAAIFSFEPSGKNFAVLKRNIQKSGFTNIQVQHCAIGGESGKSKLFLGESVNNSILSDFAMNQANSASEEIEVKTLQQVLEENSIRKVDFLKLDCEGAEYAILRSAPAEVLDKIETISMEFHDMKNVGETGEEIVAMLLKNKFEIVKYHYNKTSQGINYGKIIGTKLFSKYR